MIDRTLLRWLPRGVALVIAGMGAPAYACTLCSCTVSATGVAFGAYDPLSASPTDAVGTVTVSCSAVVALSGGYTIQLGPGQAGSYAERRLANGSNQLGYNLYLDAARTIVWGDGTGGTGTQSYTLVGLLTNDVKNYSVYAHLRAAQNVPVGSYSDTIVVTVTY